MDWQCRQGRDPQRSRRECRCRCGRTTALHAVSAFRRTGPLLGTASSDACRRPDQHGACDCARLRSISAFRCSARRCPSSGAFAGRCDLHSEGLVSSRGGARALQRAGQLLVGIVAEGVNLLKTIRLAASAALSLWVCASAAAQPGVNHPWLNPALSPEARARAAMAAMTVDEKLRLVFGYSDQAFTDLAKVRDDIVSPELKAYVVSHQVKGSAGFVPGIPRLGIPDQTQTDASIGVRNSLIPSTALPSSLASAASFDPQVPRAGGAMIGAEARATRHNTMLSGGINLAREPRNGRNFEYAGEDPLLAGTMVGALIDGIQSNHIVSTIKHYALNDQETERTSLDVTISAEAMRQSDLLAFELAMEAGKPGSVMCSYNLINGRWGCENDYLVNTVLKHDWGFKGFVMSDWGAVHSTAAAANNGLDQFTGFCCVTDKPWFGPPAMKAALQSGAIPQRRLDDMAERIVWALFAKGAVDDPVKPSPIDYVAHAMVSQKAAEDSLVLLKNDGDLLPLRGVKSIAVIGGNADKGVLAGGGSSDVTPVGGAITIDNHTFLPSAPLAALKRELPRANINFDAGADPASAAALA